MRRLKGLKLVLMALVMMCGVQHQSRAQIITQTKLIDAPFASILQYSDNEYIYVSTEGNPDDYKNNITLTSRNLNG